MGEVSLLFLVDCTGSMATWISQVKTDINDIVGFITKEMGKNSHINLGFVGYRDWNDGDKRIETYPFTKDVELFKKKCYWYCSNWWW